MAGAVSWVLFVSILYLSAAMGGYMSAAMGGYSWCHTPVFSFKPFGVVGLTPMSLVKYHRASQLRRCHVGILSNLRFVTKYTQNLDKLEPSSPGNNLSSWGVGGLRRWFDDEYSINYFMFKWMWSVLYHVFLGLCRYPQYICCRPMTKGSMGQIEVIEKWC